MKITFSNITREPGMTYVFVSPLIVKDLRFCLDRENIPYQIFGKKDFDKVLPAGTVIPEVKAIPVLGADRICKNPAVVISHLNADQFYAKLEQIALKNDDDLQAHTKAINAQALESYETNYKHFNGQIPVAKA